MCLKSEILCKSISSSELSIFRGKMNLKKVLLTILLILILHTDSSKSVEVGGLGILSNMIDTAQSLSKMTSSFSTLLATFMGSDPGKRGADRYKHNYLIEPVTARNTTNRKRHIPMLFDMAPKSYPVEFALYTRNNLMWKEPLSVANASMSKMFDKRRETKLIIHDYNQSASDPMLLRIKTAYLTQNNDFNVIVADWAQARMYSYTVAATVTEYVGVMAARLALEIGADLSKLHVIGFGLGAHAAGVMGQDLNSQLKRITGLDPSMPLFRMADGTQKLDETDAAFVDIIHTDGGDNFLYATHLGMGDVMGHADFYVNSGIFQPGCPTSALPSYGEMYCSHIRSLELFLESVQNKDTLIGCSCSTWDAFRMGKCDCRNRMVYVGESCPRKARGKFFFMTRELSPYGIGRQGAHPPTF